MFHLFLTHAYYEFLFVILLFFFGSIQGKDVNLFQPAAEFLPMIDKVSKISCLLLCIIMKKGKVSIFCSFLTIFPCGLHYSWAGL